LRESELRLNLAADSAEAGLWVLDLRTHVFWATTKTRSIFGYAPEEVISLARFQASVYPDDWGLVQRTLDRSVQGGEPMDMEYRIRLPDGQERWIVSRGRPCFKPTGEPDRLLGLSMDVTERKQAEEGFRASEARLAAGTELAGLGYYEANYGENTCFFDARFREICGVPPALQRGLEPVQFWLEHVHPDDRQFLLNERQKLHDGKIERISAEYRYRHPSQGQKWIHHLARIAAPSPAGRGARTFGVLRDITQLKRAEQDSQELRENLTHLTRVNTLGALSGSLAHELNQPLGIILSNAQAAQELLLQQPPDVAEVQAILGDIVKADRRAGQVIERLRALLKRGQVSLQPLSLNQVLEEVLHLARADLIGRGLTVVCDLAPALPPIAGDRVQLQQLALNLILNAAEAMAANAHGARRLQLQTRLHQGRVRVAVSDEGPGLPADAERLFQPFYTTKPQGLGLGLAICRSIMDAHHGRLWAEPHPEHGAVFHFELPIAGALDEP
jgi:PAS domain S-box-containing protein